MTTLADLTPWTRVTLNGASYLVDRRTQDGVTLLDTATHSVPVFVPVTELHRLTLTDAAPEFEITHETISDHYVTASHETVNVNVSRYHVAPGVTEVGVMLDSNRHVWDLATAKAVLTALSTAVARLENEQHKP